MNEPLPMPSSTNKATDASQRFVMLDAIRGFAVLGIFAMNIQSFSMISAAYLNPLATADLAAQRTGADYWVWYVSHVFFDAKFMTLFSILFGAGIALMSQRCLATGRRPAAIHYRRLAGLLVIGLIHGYLFWSGDILVPYVICGAVVYPLWRMKNSVLWCVAAGLFLVGSFAVVAIGLSMPYWPEDELVLFEQEAWRPTAEIVAAEIEAYTGPWRWQLADRARVTLEIQVFGMALVLFWQISALMLIGMSLVKNGVLIGLASSRFYVALIGMGFGIGLPLVIWGTHLNEQHQWSMDYSMTIGTQPNYFGSLLMAMGYLGLWGIAIKHNFGQRIAALFAPIGRMALTNYLMQTLIGTTVFYGHALGFFMQVDRTGQFAIVIGVWCFQIAFSHWWMKRYRFGPAEYVWRMLTYGQRPGCQT